MPSFSGSPALIARRIRAILSSRGLTLADAARRSRQEFVNDRRFHIPSNLYYIVQHTGFSPGIHQLFALSFLTDYRLVDWFAVFGLVLDDIPRMQAVLPTRFTTLIENHVYDDRGWMLSFERSAASSPPDSLSPFGQLFRIGRPRRFAGVPRKYRSPFLYAKIGFQDALAFPDLLPGSIVRIVKTGESAFGGIPAGRRGGFFLIEHARGLTCTRVHILRKNRFVLSPTELPFAQIEFELGKEARILGGIDFELRPGSISTPAGVARGLYRFWLPEPLKNLMPGAAVGDLLRRSRRRSGLTIREASDKSALIADALKNPEFFCAAGALSDYESQTSVPRHLHKILSLCILYSLGVWEIIAAAGLPLSKAGTATVPDELMNRTATHLDSNQESDTSSGSIQLAEFPYFFGRTAAEYFDMEHLSIRDLFWFVRSKQSFHPYLADAVALIVDRRKKRVVGLPQAPLWAQPLYVLLGRDQKYVCASGIQEGKILTIRPFSDGIDRPLRLTSQEDAEVIGRVVGILRRPRP